MNPFDLSGRVAFVTGAGSGLGRGVAQALASAGAEVICADVDEAAARRTAESLGGHGSAAGLDVRDRAAFHEAVQHAVAAYGAIDALCNVAGIPGSAARVLDLDEAELDRMISVNLKGVLYGCQAGLAVMGPRGSGSIVNMASSAIDVPTAGLAPYTMTKAAVAALTKVLAVEAGAQGVRVNAVAPGWVRTPLSTAHATAPDGTVDADAVAHMVESMSALSPLRRVGTVADVAHQFVYLCSDAAAFVTGQTLRPNGGASMPW